jgi:hypothetical protein
MANMSSAVFRFLVVERIAQTPTGESQAIRRKGRRSDRSVITKAELVGGKRLTLPPLEAAGFLLHPRLPAVAGLTPGPQAFYFPCAPRRSYKVDA